MTTPAEFTLFFQLQGEPRHRLPAGEPRGGQAGAAAASRTHPLSVPHVSAEKPGLRPGFRSQQLAGRNVRFLPSPDPETADRRPGFRRRAAWWTRMLICRLPRKRWREAQGGGGGVARLSGRRRGGGWAPGCLGA